MRFEPIEARHAALTFDDAKDPALYEFIEEQPPASVEQLEQRYAKLAAGSSDRAERWHNWIAFDAGAPIGHLQATLHKDRHAGVAWMIFPRYWRRGFGTLAASWLLRNLGDAVLARAAIDARNAASLALAGKLGFVLIGTRDGDAIFARPVLEPDEIRAQWAEACRSTSTWRGADKCRLVPHLGALALAAIDDRALALLGELLSDRDGWSEDNPYSADGDNISRIASLELAMLGARGEPVLAGKLAQLEGYMRENAMRALATLPALSDATLAEVVRVAGAQPGTSFAAAVGDVLAKHHVDCAALFADPKTRYAAMVGTPALGAARLIELLDDADPHVRKLAINRLRWITPLPEHAAPAIVALLVDRDRDVADEAARALEYFARGDPAVTRALWNAIAIPYATPALLGRPRDQLAALLPEIDDRKLADAIRAKLTSA
ncbi:MAG TPA: GNAT family N-acetyltransferase [Kofleriaceae bacterium]|jgi:RimJ/RimL family protein N-acetyltransferase